MGKQRARCGAGRCRGHALRNTVIALSILGTFLTLVVVSQPGVMFPLSMSYTIGNENWECQTSIRSGSVAGQYYKIPSEVTVAYLPPYVIGTPTSSKLTIDPDYTLGTVTAHAWDKSPGITAPADGHKPDVILEITQVIPTDSAGAPTVKPEAAKEWDDTTGTVKVHWYQYYFYFEVEAKTATTTCNEAFGYMLHGDAIANSREALLYEHDAVQVELGVAITLQSIYQNASFQSHFADARVTYVHMNYNPSTVSKTDFVSRDYVGSMYNDYDINAKLNPIYDTTSGASGEAILVLSGMLQPGIQFNQGGSNLEFNYGIKQQVNVRLVYGVLFSVQVTRPLEQSDREEGAGKFQLIDYLVGVMQDPNDPAFWVLWLAVILVIYLVIPKKKAAQAIQQHFHLEGRSKGGGAAS